MYFGISADGAPGGIKRKVKCMSQATRGKQEEFFFRYSLRSQLSYQLGGLPWPPPPTQSSSPPLAWFFFKVLITIQNYPAYFLLSVSPHYTSHEGRNLACLVYCCMYQNMGYLVDAQHTLLKWMSGEGKLRKEQEEAKVGIRPRFESKSFTYWLCALGIIIEPLWGSVLLSIKWATSQRSNGGLNEIK